MMRAGCPITSDDHTTMLPYCEFFSTLPSVSAAQASARALGGEDGERQLQQHAPEEPQLEKVQRHAHQQLVEEG